MSLKLFLAFCLTIAICFGDRHTGKDECIKMNLNYGSNDISGGLSKQSTWQECQIHCRTNADCLYWTFRIDGNCWLKSAKWDGTVENGMVSGPRECPDDCIKMNVNYGGNDISGGLSKQSTWQECQTHCGTNADCLYWTFRISDGNCWLKSAKWYGTMENGMVSGPRECPDECIKMNVNYGGNDISGGLSKQSTWEECQTHCGTNADCLYWTFRTSDGNCWLKSANDVKTVANGVVSGPRECPGSCDSCLKPGVDGGYMEYSQVQEKLAELWANATKVSDEVQENALAIETKCLKDKCEKIEANTTKIEESLEKLKTDNITALEEKVAVLMEKVAANEAALSAKCDATKCTTIQTNLTKVESCLGDVTSTDCPTISGKTGVVATISTNTAALENKCDVANCTAIKIDIDSVESCLADKSSGTCPAATAGKVSVTDAITSLETPPLFNCIFTNGDVATTVDILSPYTCDINEDNVIDPATGKFTVAKAGKYRLTFMALNVPLKKKKVICLLVKTSSGTETKIARSVAQSMIGDEEEQITITIDIIHDLKLGDTIHMNIIVKVGTKIVGVAADKPQQVTFTGEFLRE